MSVILSKKTQTSFCFWINKNVISGDAFNLHFNVDEENHNVNWFVVEQDLKKGKRTDKLFFKIIT